MDIQTPADDSVRQEFIDMYEDTLVDLMEKNGDAPLTEDAERTMRVNAMVDTALASGLCSYTRWSTRLCACAAIWIPCWLQN